MPVARRGGAGTPQLIKTVRRGRESDEQTMERLRRERNGLKDELASSSAARDGALAQVEAVQLKLGKALSSPGGGAALAEAQRKIQALAETIKVCEQHISGSDAAIEATAERGRRRLERSKKRESELEAVVLKTQQQSECGAVRSSQSSSRAGVGTLEPRGRDGEGRGCD